LFLPLLAIILLSAALLQAQTGEMTVRGASHFSGDYIRGLFRGRPFDTALVALHAAYADDGYLDAAITGDSIAGITVVEGSRYSIGGVRLLPDSLAALLQADGIRTDDLIGRYFSTADIDAEMRRLVAALGNRGYPLASARIGDVEIDDTTHEVLLTVELSSSDRIRISEVDVQGNTSTQRSLILTAAAIPPNALFTDELAAQVRGRLERLTIFSEVGEPQLYRTDSGAYGLLLTVTEGSTNTFDGVVGFEPGGDTSTSAGLSGLVNVVLRNILGTGRRASFRWQRQARSGSQLEVRYGEPFILGFPLDLDISYRQYQEDATPALLSYVQRYFAGDFYYGLTDAFSIRLGGAYESTIPQIDSAQPCNVQLLNSRTLETTIGIGYDTRSNTINPISGVNYATTYSVGSKQILGPDRCDSGLVENDTRQRVELDLDAYLGVGRFFVIASGIHYGEVRGELLEESDMFRFGGQTTVRGYGENIFHASRRAWGTLEARFLLSTSSYAALFFDAGYYLRPANALRGVEQFDEWLYGYGAGAQIETPLGLVRLSYALSREDTFATGKVYVGLVNQF
jgi:outer membrane protein insertion porin family